MTENADVRELGEVTITRVFDAPREMVFRAFIEPEQLTHFWGPVGLSTPLETITVDPRPGGAYEMVMVADEDGAEYPVKGVFVEIVQPERLVFTEPDFDMTQTLTFTDLDGKTELVIHQTGVPPRFRTPEALAGYDSMLDRLIQHLRIQKENIR
jgi:uncharacterized protein YndB with AHSA1/START domain